MYLLVDATNKAYKSYLISTQPILPSPLRLGFVLYLSIALDLSNYYYKQSMIVLNLTNDSFVY